MKITTHDQVTSLWLDHRDGLRNYLLKKLKDPHTAEDLTQEVLLKVYKACCSDRPIGNARSWLFQIAYHLAVDYLRRASKQAAEVPELPDDPDSNTWRVLAEFVEPLIDCLPEKYGQPLRWYELEGVPQAEIAQRLGLGLSAAKSRVQRARKHLQTEIAECINLELDDHGQLLDFRVKDHCSTLLAYQQNGYRKVVASTPVACC